MSELTITDTPNTDSLLPCPIDHSLLAELTGTISMFKGENNKCKHLVKFNCFHCDEIITLRRPKPKPVGICDNCEAKGKKFPNGEALDIEFRIKNDIVYYKCYYCKEPNQTVFQCPIK